MNKSPATEAIATLINLAQQGEIDPWDVQVIEIIDRFLAELGLIGETSVDYLEADLPQSGQAFLWASMLVLLKADTLETIGQEEQEQEMLEVEIDDYLGTSSSSLPINLEQCLSRRKGNPPLRKRRVTLQELITQLEKIAVELEAKPIPNPKIKNRNYTRKETLKAIASLAHQENLTEVAGQLEKFFLHILPNLAPHGHWIDLEQLLDWWSEPRHQQNLKIVEKTTEKDKVGVFWALLLLSAQSKVELSQSEFYQDLKLRPMIVVQ